MEKRFLTPEEANMCKTFLTQQDYIAVAEKTGFSVSTVNNLINGRAKLSGNTKNVLEALNVACYAKMMQIGKLIQTKVPEFKKLEEVKEYRDLKQKDKWI